MKSDNELIAEFMGFKRCDEDRYVEYVAQFPNDGHNRSYYYTPKETKSSKQQNVQVMKFDTSWDWLMPVVEKIGVIEDIDLDIYLYSDTRGCTIFGMSEYPPYINIGRDEDKDNPTLIQKTYKAVIEFIKWYNTQKK